MKKQFGSLFFAADLSVDTFEIPLPFGRYNDTIIIRSIFTSPFATADILKMFFTITRDGVSYDNVIMFPSGSAGNPFYETFFVIQPDDKVSFKLQQSTFSGTMDVGIHYETIINEVSDNGG